MKYDGIESLFDTLLIVAPGGQDQPALYSIYRDFGCKILLASSDEEALNIMKTEPQIDVVLFEVQSGKPVSSCFEFVRHVRKLNPDLPPIFVVCDGVEAYFGDLFYEGVAGVFMTPLDLGEFTKAVAVSYSELLGHSDRQFKRRQLQRAGVSYSIDSQSTSGYATDISLGGMFIGTMNLLPFKDQPIRFRLSIENHSALSGGAVVKWLRPQIVLGRARGFGIEFSGVDKTVLENILERRRG